MYRFWEAVLILAGMIIGVGMFGIPFSFARAGFWLGTFELVVLTGVVLLFHLLYSDVVLGTKELHRLPGYAAIYLGRRAEVLARFSVLFGISGTLLAYVVVGSVFLNNIFPDLLPADLWAVLIIIAGAMVNILGLKKEALLNGILTALLIGFIAVLIFFLSPHINTENLSGWNPGNFFLPYGVLLFALSGGVVVPEVVTLLNRDKSASRRAIVIGTLLPAILYFFFALAVVGVAGDAVSEEAIAGLLDFVGKNLVILGSAIGFLAVFTSFMMLNSNFQAMFTLDFKFSSFASWLFVSLIPAVLYFLGFQNFIAIIGAVGAIGVGIDSALILAAHYKLFKDRGVMFSPVSYFWRLAIFAMIAGGVVYELSLFFKSSS